VFFICVFHSFAQPTIQWQKSLGGTNRDHASCIVRSNDGGYVVAGSSDSNDGDVTGNHGNLDFWIVKLNAIGVIQWEKSLGGSADEIAYSIQQTVDSGYIVAGFSNSYDGDISGNHGNTDCWVVKLSSTGALQWEKSLGGSADDFAYAVQQTIEGGYVVAGFSDSNDSDVTSNHGSSDFWVVKLSDTGIIQWDKTLGGSAIDIAHSVQQTSDSGYIVAGNSYSIDGDVTGNHGSADCWVVKLNTSGTIQWQKSLGGTGDEVATDIQQSNDGGYIVAANSNSNDGDVTSNHGYTDYWIIKLNSVGVIEWEKSLGGSDDDIAHSIQETSDGGYVVAGSSYSINGDVTGNHGSWDNWVVQLNSQGNIQWQKSFGGSSEDDAYSIRQTTDGGYGIAGESISSDGDITGNHGNYDCWILKLNAVTSVEENSSSATLHIFPNPATSIISVESIAPDCSYQLYDLTGKRLMNNLSTTTKCEIDLSDFDHGIYFLTIDEKGKLTHAKIVKE